MGIETIVGGAIGLIGSSMQSDAAQSAADTQSAASRYATDIGNQQFQQTRADQMPFMQTGYKANDLLNALMASGAYGSDPTFAQYKQDPSYAWQQKEGAKAVQGSAAARGGLYSGEAMRALQDRAQNIANADYGNWWNRTSQGLANRTNLLNAIRTGGQAATNQVGSLGQTNALQAGQNAIGAANAQGAAGIAGANSWTNALNGISSSIKNNRVVNPYMPDGYNTPTWWSGRNVQGNSDYVWDV